jgi:hypothetical protein
MTITYPRQLPNNAHMSEAWFELMDNVAASPFGNGNKINLSQVNDPTWKGTFKTGILNRDDAAIWQAWKKSLRGGIQKFIAYDVRKSTLRAYPNAKSAANIAPGWDGTCTVASVGLSGALGLSGLPLAGLQFKAGDRVGLEQAGFYGYYEVMEDVTGGASTASITVAPFLHSTVFTAGTAVCRLWRPWCKFVITDWVESGTVEDAPVNFSGVQTL